MIYKRDATSNKGQTLGIGFDPSNSPLLFSSDARPAFARPNPHVDRNVMFVDGPVNHFASAFVPGGAVPGAPDPAWLGLASSDGDVVRDVETTEAAAEDNYRRDQEKRGTAAKL
jgi:hypothetical protein